MGEKKQLLKCLKEQHLHHELRNSAFVRGSGWTEENKRMIIFSSAGLTLQAHGENTWMASANLCRHTPPQLLQGGVMHDGMEAAAINEPLDTGSGIKDASGLRTETCQLLEDCSS